MFVLVFILNTATNNYSQVDKLWSIMPMLYSWIMVYKSGFNSRLLLATSLITLWGSRLTYNFSKKGGYSWKFWEGEEDYRWAHVRKIPFLTHPVSWFLFNLFFISLYQSYLIMGFTLPLVLTFGQTTPLGTLDYLASALFLGFLTLEAVADYQQWVFQEGKRKALSSGKEVKEPYKTGFIRSGVWKFSRHPNYFSEQAIWVTIYIFSIAATGRYINWSFIGSLLLMLLFRGSADLSEGISAKKYPAYKEYMQKTPMFIPKLF